MMLLMMMNNYIKPASHQKQQSNNFNLTLETFLLSWSFLAFKICMFCPDYVERE
jgi:hypothetical protein